MLRVQLGDAAQEELAQLHKVLLGQVATLSATLDEEKADRLDNVVLQETLAELEGELRRLRSEASESNASQGATE